MLVKTIAFLLLAGGFLAVSGISLRQLAAEAAQRPRQPPTAYEIITGQPPNAVARRIFGMFRQMKSTLEAVGLGKQYAGYCVLSVMLAAAGALLSLFLANPFLLPFAVLLGMYLPVLAARFSAAGYKKRQDAEVETGLSIVTSSYKRTDNLLQSVAENVEYLHDPVKSAFRRFLSMNEFLTTNVEKSLYDLKGAIQSSIWAEWCDAMVLCVHDHTKKDMLDVIVRKMRHMDTVQAELDAMLYEPLKTFVQMAALLLVNYPMLYFINRNWFHILLFSVPGKIACAATAAAMLFSLSAVIRATSPIEYKR